MVCSAAVQSNRLRRGVWTEHGTNKTIGKHARTLTSALCVLAVRLYKVEFVRKSREKCIS